MKKKIAIIILFFIFSSFNSYALIEVDITRGNLNPLPVAVSPLFVDSVSESKISEELKGLKIGSEISKIVENNLKQTGLFNPLNKDAFLQKPGNAIWVARTPATFRKGSSKRPHEFNSLTLSR